MTWCWKSLFRKPELDSQMDAELRFHIEEVTRANIASGMSPQEARRRAVLDFGGHEQIKEDVRDVHRMRYLESAMANCKAAFRFIRKGPSFSAAVILTLALGIGANSAVFSAIDAILLRPLPVPDSQQLMRLYQLNLQVKGTVPFAAPVRLEDWNRTNSTFQALTGYYVENASETSGTLPEKVRQAFVAQRFLQVWGVAPAIGRDFTPEEQRFGGPGAVLISDRFWRNRFGGNPDVLGKKIRIGNSFSLTIVGVMSPSFVFPERDIDLWSAVPSDAPYAQNRRSTWYTVIGRLKPGVTVSEARANLVAVQGQLGKAFPETDADLSVAVEPLKETKVASSRSSLWLLFGSVSLLLLIACTNIVTLLLARASQRQHEIAVRYSLGASRNAIIAQLLTEVFALAFLGAGLALLVAAGASSAFRSLAADLPRVEEIHLDWRIVLYAFACSLVATLLCGLIPAIRATRRPLTSSLAQASHTQVSGRNRLQWLLVGTQVALAVTLLAGAGLLLRSFQALGRVSPGFDASRVLTFRISGSYGETADWKQLTHRIQQTLDTLSALPGIESAATAGNLPGVSATYPTELNFLEGEQNQQRKIMAESRFVSPSYPSTLQIPLLAGELCRDPLMQQLPVSSQALALGNRVEISRIEVLVNQNFAQTYSAGVPAVGRHLRVIGNAFLPPDKSGEIRGVVADAREEGMNHAPGPTVYWCMTTSGPDPFYLVRTRSSQPLTAATMLRKRIQEIEPTRSVFDITPLADRIDDAFAENRMRTVLLAFFAVTAIALASVGLYGTLSYSVNVRQREVGLRLALGALRGNIARQFLLQGLRVAAFGSAIGWMLAAGSGRLLAGMLYGVTPSDVMTLASAVILMLLVATAASLIPSLRAARLDPMHVLREE
jgi:putative ABC transport system permease protein